ncbi:MAG: hypothetical protein AAFX06_29785 [Planctomycetota bacterium]
MTQTQQKPADTIRYLGVKGVIWRNPGGEDRPDYFVVQYLKTYTDDQGNYHDTSSLSERDNLKLGILYTKVANRIEELKNEGKSNVGGGHV